MTYWDIYIGSYKLTNLETLKGDPHWTDSVRKSWVLNHNTRPRSWYCYAAPHRYSLIRSRVAQKVCDFILIPRGCVEKKSPRPPVGTPWLWMKTSPLSAVKVIGDITNLTLVKFRFFQGCCKSWRLLGTANGGGFICQGYFRVSEISFVNPKWWKKSTIRRF